MRQLLSVPGRYAGGADAPSLTNEWTEVKLKAGSVDVDSDGHIIIQHQTESQDQGYYILQSVK